MGLTPSLAKANTNQAPARELNASTLKDLVSKLRGYEQIPEPTTSQAPPTPALATTEAVKTHTTKQSK